MEGYLLYRVVLVSAKHQHELALGIHMPLENPIAWRATVYRGAKNQRGLK